MDAPPVLVHARGRLVLDRCLVVGILNRTPDSFYDGGRMRLQQSVDHGRLLVEQGADMIDVGAVKAGPGPEVTERDELERLVTVVEALARRVDVPLSVETARPAVARAAIEAGAAVVNDVSALQDPALAEVCAATGAGLVLMHNGGQIRGRPRHPRYADIVAEIRRSWESMAAAARSAGVAEDRLIVDPGLDFGKTTYHSLEIMRRLDELIALPWPVLVAPSRKDVVGETLGLAPQDRLEGTLALVALSALVGAAAVRVHDVAAGIAVVRMAEAVRGAATPVAPVRGLWD